MSNIRPKNRKAISVVMTTLIILVASVVLGTGVVLFGTSLFQTAGQTQSIQSQGIKLWVNSTAQGTTNWSWGAAAIRNNGDVLASVNTIQIRGVSVPFTSWYVDSNQTEVGSGSNFQSNFNYTKNDANGNLYGTNQTGGVSSYTAAPFSGMKYCYNTKANTTPYTTIVMDTDGGGTNSPMCLKQISAPVTLNPGAKMVVYFKMPAGIVGPVDAGSAVTVNIFAGNVGGPATVTVGNP